MDRLRSIEPNRRIITLIEDFERLAKDDYYSAMLLQLLDGNGQFDNVVTIATTNYPEILEKRFTCRPSRFNLVIEYKKPNADARRAYIENKLSDSGIDITDEGVKKDIDRYVRKTEGYTFDFLKEVIQGIYVDGFTEIQLFERLEDLIKKDGKVKVTEDGAKKIGFNSGGTVESNDCEEEDSPSLLGTITEESPRVVRQVPARNKVKVSGFGE
jgi:SpoVK/Ycf46/Vps4 family AAA+-type ATPase